MAVNPFFSYVGLIPTTFTRIANEIGLLDQKTCFIHLLLGFNSKSLFGNFYQVFDLQGHSIIDSSSPRRLLSLQHVFRFNIVCNQHYSYQCFLLDPYYNVSIKVNAILYSIPYNTTHPFLSTAISLQLAKAHTQGYDLSQLKLPNYNYKLLRISPYMSYTNTLFVHTEPRSEHKVAILILPRLTKP